MHSRTSDRCAVVGEAQRIRRRILRYRARSRQQHHRANVPHIAHRRRRNSDVTSSHRHRDMNLRRAVTMSRWMFRTCSTTSIRRNARRSAHRWATTSCSPAPVPARPRADPPHRAGCCEVEHASPWSILAVTFTNKAAGEMRARCDALIRQGTRAAVDRHVPRHRASPAAPALARSEVAGNVPDPRLRRPATPDQARRCRALGLDDSRFPPRQAAWFINSAKDEGKRAGRVPGRIQPDDAHAGRHLQSVRGSVRSDRAWSISPNCCCARTSCG